MDEIFCNDNVLNFHHFYQKKKIIIAINIVYINYYMILFSYLVV